MGKTTKIYVNKAVSAADVSAALKNADENDLRILSLLLLTADSEGGASLSGIEELLGLDRADALASVKFWRGAGVLTSCKTVSSEKAEKAESKERVTAHKGGVVSTFTGVEAYTNDELTRLLETNAQSGFIDEAQKIMGKIFNKNEVGKLVGITEQLGFEPEAVLAILSYCVRLEKKSLSYAEKIAISFHDEDIFTAEEIHARIDQLEKRNSALEKIRWLFGFGGRALTTSEKKLFAAWTEDFGYSFEIIQKAYEITVDTIHEPAPKYTNGILKKWYENGLETTEQIDEYIAVEKQKSAKALKQPQASGRTAAKTVQKNEDMEDWFEQRLKNTFG